MAMYAINKKGLREKPSYDELVGYLEYGQEKISYPDRFFKQLRETPQLSNLLDGEGMTIKELEEQQVNQAKEIQKEHAIRQAGGTAQQLRTMEQKTQTDKIKSNVGSSQTLNPKFASTGSQAWRPNVASGGVQTEGAQYFDMTMDDKIADVNEQLETELDKNDANREQKRDNIVNILEKHLGEEVTPSQLDFAHQIASSSGASSSTSITPIRKQTTKQSKKNTGDPETDTEPKGKAGRPKKDTKARMEQLADIAEDVEIKDKETTPEKRERKASNGNGTKPTKKAKAKQEESREHKALMNTVVKEQKKQEKQYSPETTQPSSSSASAESPKAKKTIEKTKQIAPSQIGIQKVREELQEAKQKGKLSDEDVSKYMILYDEWLGAKGNQKVKKEKLNALREIYKRAIYKK